MAYAVMPTGFKGTEDPGVTAPGFSVVRAKEKMIIEENNV